MRALEILRPPILLAGVWVILMGMILTGIAVARSKPPRRAAYLALEAVLLVAICVTAGLLAGSVSANRLNLLDCAFDRPPEMSIGECISYL